MIPPNLDLLVIVQARMGSRRFPGKSMFSFAGKPALQHLLEALLQTVQRRRLCVVTSQDPANEPITALCSSQGVLCLQGDENNVASRFLAALLTRPSTYFARLSGDSPLFDFRLLEAAAALIEQADLVSTALGRRYPSGMNVELMRSRVFQDAYPKFATAGQLEHVTSYFYERRPELRCLALDCPLVDAGRYKFSFDTAEDRLRLEKLFLHLKRPHYEYTFEQKCSLYQELFLGQTG